MRRVSRRKDKRKRRRKGQRKKKKRKWIYLLMFIYEGVPPTLKVAKYIPFFCKKNSSFAVNEAAVMDTYAAS